jgi:hypothetical protein
VSLWIFEVFFGKADFQEVHGRQKAGRSPTGKNFQPYCIAAQHGTIVFCSVASAGV